MRDMSVASFGSGVRDAVHRLATGCVGNGVERAGYNFHYCIKTANAPCLTLSTESGTTGIEPRFSSSSSGSGWSDLVMVAWADSAANQI